MEGRLPEIIILYMLKRNFTRKSGLIIMSLKEKLEKIVFITGAHKTGTSPIVGILNCHPKIFILYETILHRGLPGKYA